MTMALAPWPSPSRCPAQQTCPALYRMAPVLLLLHSVGAALATSLEAAEPATAGTCLLSLHAERQPDRRHQGVESGPTGRVPPKVEVQVPHRRLRRQDMALATVAADRTAQKGQSIKSGKPASWFGSFSQGESTYTEDGVDAGDLPRFVDSVELKDSEAADQHDAWRHDSWDVEGSEWFHESASAGHRAAWQTHFPALESGSLVDPVPGDRHFPSGDMRHTPVGWVQDYVVQGSDTTPDDLHPSNILKKSAPWKDADWFDNSVQQYDGYGRQQLPDPHSSHSGRFLLQGFKEKSVNVTIACKDPGCTGSAVLQLYNPKKQEARHCRLNILMHPTDFDNEWSEEQMPHWKANGLVVTKGCNSGTLAAGCNKTTRQQLIPCLNAFDADRLVVDNNGTLELEGRISNLTDECPYEGNLLSAIATATCMVREIDMSAFKMTTTTTTPIPRMNQEVLQCKQNGCIAEALVPFSPGLALNGGTCLLGLNVTQTDFDDAAGVPEEIEWIEVEGMNVTKAPVKPGKNPCVAKLKGTPLKASELHYEAIKEFDVTQMAKVSHPMGHLKVRAKISENVDECGFDGHLFHSLVTVICTPPPGGLPE